MVWYLVSGVLCVVFVWSVRLLVVGYRLRRNAVAFGSYCKKKGRFLEVG